jgi:hypothetical protein
MDHPAETQKKTEQHSPNKNTQARDKEKQSAAARAARSFMAGEAATIGTCPTFIGSSDIKLMPNPTRIHA